MSETKLLITSREVCKRLSISRTTLWKWKKEKPDFPRGIRVSQVKTLFKASEVEEWVAKLGKKTVNKRLTSPKVKYPPAFSRGDYDSAEN